MTAGSTKRGQAGVPSTWCYTASSSVSSEQAGPFHKCYAFITVHHFTNWHLLPDVFQFKNSKI